MCINPSGTKDRINSTLASTSSSAYSARLMTSTAPNVRPFLRFLTDRRTLLMSAPFSRGVMVVSQRSNHEGLEPLHFQLSFAHT